MNCRPGDLAVIVRADGMTGDKLIGRIVRVTTLRDTGKHWNYEGPAISTVWGPVIGLADDALRPIRDPGDDAVDETLLRLPAPRVTEAA